MDLKHLFLHGLGIAVVIGLTYTFAWTVNWLCIILGFYVFGFSISVIWKDSVERFLFAPPVMVLIGFLLALLSLIKPDVVGQYLFGQLWCGIQPCMPMWVVVVSALIGSSLTILPEYVWRR